MSAPRPEELPPPPPGREGWPWQADPSPPPAEPAGGWPLVSALIPCRNAGDFLEAALRSLLLQGYPALELIVVDGASTDHTLEVARRYRPWLAHLISEPDRGQSHALNKGLALARGEFVCWLNADDLWLPGALFTLAAALAAAPGAPLATGGTVYLDAAGNEISREPARFSSWADYALRRCMIRQSASLFRRRAVEAAGGWDESLSYTMDRDLLLRLTRQAPPAIVSQAVGAYRVHGGAKTRRADTLVARVAESDRMTARHLAGTPWLKEFRRQRAFAWLELATRPGLSSRARLRALGHALGHHPLVAAYPDFRRALAVVLRGGGR